MKRLTSWACLGMLMATFYACTDDPPEGGTGGSAAEGGAGTVGGGGAGAEGGGGSGGAGGAAEGCSPAACEEAPSEGEGSASLYFEPRFGDPAMLGEGISGYAPGAAGEGDAPLVLMLCDVDDTMCDCPLVMRELTHDDPVQRSFGPDVTVDGLPEGDYRAMIFMDTLRSRELGYGWQDDFEGCRIPHWGGVVSEGDWMMSSDSAAEYKNPAPAPVEITLAAGETADLGVIELGHYPARNIYPQMETENGVLAVSTHTGIRVIDMATWPYELRTAYEVSGTKYYEYQLTDDSGELLPGAICGLVDAPNKTVIALMDGGYAVQFDPETGTQLNKVSWPQPFPDTGGKPCKGLVHEAGGQTYLFANGEGNVWYANITNLASGDVTGGVLTSEDEDVFNVNLINIAAHEQTLILTANPGASEQRVPPEARGKRVLLFADIDAGTGAITALRRTSGDVDFVEVGPVMDSYDTGSVNGVMGCNPNFDSEGLTGLKVVTFHDGRDLLFAGGCMQIYAFDIADGYTKLDYNGPAPGRPGLNATEFGQQFGNFELSPDGTTLWAFPFDKSELHLNSEQGLTGQRTTHNRLMALPIDLTGGTLPTYHADYTTGDIDNYEGEAGFKGYTTPADDPGVDLNNGHYSAYQLKWAKSSSGVLLGAATFPTGPSFAVTGTTLWMRGSGAQGAGTGALGKAGNIASYSLAERRAYYWPREHVDTGLADPQIHHFWMSGTDPDYRFGFDLTPGSAPGGDGEVSTTGVRFISLD